VSRCRAETAVIKQQRQAPGLGARQHGCPLKESSVHGAVWFEGFGEEGGSCKGLLFVCWDFSKRCSYSVHGESGGRWWLVGISASLL
jgi:hypothetical protein